MSIRKPEFLFLLVFGLMVVTSPSLAERNNFFNATTNIVGSYDDNPSVSGLRLDQVSQGYRPTAGLYPSLEFHSLGPSSDVLLYYRFGYDWVDSDIDLNSESHGVGVDWRYESPKVRFSLKDDFRQAPDFSTFNLFQGIVFTPEGIFFDYETVALRRDSINNNASMNLERRLGEKSWFSVRVAHSLREYDENELFQARLPNQTQITGGAGLIRELSRKAKMSLNYDYSQYAFDGDFYSDSRQHVLMGNFDYELAESVTLNVGAGPSYVELIGEDDNNFGYNITIGVNKRFERDLLSIYYNKRDGASTGIGSISKTQQVGIGLTHPLGRRHAINFSAGYTDSKQLLDNVFDFSGLYSSLSFDIGLSEHWIVSVGGSYQHQEEDANLIEPDPGFDTYRFDRRRFFVSLRFVIPEFWRF